MKSSFGWLPPAAALLTFVVGCGQNPRAQLPEAAPTAPASQVQPSAPAAAATDPVQTLIDLSERHFVNGQRELELGHLQQAKAEFDLALGVLLESPHGGRSDGRMRDQFDRMVDRISAVEATALAQGDGFAEKKYEPATIDALLGVSTFEPPPAAAQALQDTVEADLEATVHDVPIPLNQKVLSYVELFQGRLRDFIADGLKRGSRYLPMIQSVFRAEGLPLDLAYIPLIESAFKPNALSRAKAKGVWQFMRGTALEHGLKTDWYIDERSDPEKATYAAAKYLKTLHTMFDGDWHLAMASYNGGPGRVQRALKRAKAESFWSLARSTKYLPRETREYVPMILAAIIIAKNPIQYGFETIEPDPIKYDKVTVPRAVDLRRVAEWTGVSIDEIQALNPELRRWTTPVRYPNYEVKVPEGRAETLRERLGAADPTELTALRWHTVKKGETLATIARTLKVSRADLAEANHLTLKSRVRAGQDLIIPRAPAVALAARVDRPAPVEEIIASARPVPIVPAVSTPAVDSSGRTKLIYRVKAGDTLFSIARLFKTTVASLKSWNRLATARINPGDRLTIFARTMAAAAMQ
jgi:membrane-bound lytic murein transglycosylase D